MSDFRFSCPLCNKPLKAPSSVVGQSITCPSCHGDFTVTNDTSRETPPPTPPETPQTKACPFCGEQILVQAKKCKHCGEFLDDAQKPKGTSGNRVILSQSKTYQPEKTEYEAHPAMFRSDPVVFILTLALCFVGVGLIILLIWWLNNLGTTLTVTSKRTILRRGILSKFTSEVYHKDVRNIQVSQRLLQRLFDVGTVGISSAGQSGIEIAAEGIPEPNRVKQIIDRYRND